MSYRSFVLPALSLGLIYTALSFGFIALNLGNDLRIHGVLSAFVHFVLLQLTALGVYLWERAAVRRVLPEHPRFFPFMIIFLGLVCIATTFMPGETVWRLYSGMPSLISVSAAVFLPIGFNLFFRAVPSGLEGILFGLIMGAGELLWAGLVPLSGGSSCDMASVKDEILHIVGMYSLTMGSAGLLLGAALRSRGRAAALELGPALADIKDILWLFAALLGGCMLMGLETGMIMPKTALPVENPAWPRLILVFFLPLTGYILDSCRPERVIMPLFPALLGIPLLGPALEGGLLNTTIVFCLIALVRQTLLMLLFIAMVRRLKNKAALSLLLGAAYCLYFSQAGGVFLRGLCGSLPGGLTAAAFILALGAFFCLWRFRLLLVSKPEALRLPAKSSKDAASGGMVNDEREKCRNFAAVHDLTPKETDVLLLLVQRRSVEDICRCLDISARTAQFHISNLLHKTGVLRRRHLLNMYASYAKSSS